MHNKSQLIKSKEFNGSSNQNPPNRRENGWNNRFIYGKIQDYNAYHDKYCKVIFNCKLLDISMRITQEQTKIYEAAKNDIQGYPHKPYSSISGFHSTKTPHSKSFNVMMNEENNETNHNSSNNNNNEIEHIRRLWNELGVVNDYRQLFGIVADQLDVINKGDFLANEIESLEYLASLLEKMTKDIHSRLTLINYIKQKDTDIGYMTINSKADVEEGIFDDVIDKMQEIRKVTISIVQNMTKIREDCAYSILGGKFDLNRLAKKYYFDKNYLIKMKDQLDFLKMSNLKSYFSFIEGDPFLLQPIEPLEEDGRTVPINEDDHRDIKKCKYYILIDMIYFQIGNSKGTIFKDHTPMNHKMNSTDAFKQYLMSNKPREYSTQQLRKDTNKFPQILNNKGASFNDTRIKKTIGMENSPTAKNRTIERRGHQGMEKEGRYSQSTNNIFGNNKKGDINNVNPSAKKGKIINEHSSNEEESKEDLMKNNELKRLMKEKNDQNKEKSTVIPSINNHTGESAKKQVQSIQSKQKGEQENDKDNNNPQNQDPNLDELN